VNFLGIGGLELVLIGIVAFLVVGPKRLSEGARTAAKVLRELRRQRDELTGMVREAVDLEDIQSDMDGYPPASSVPRTQDTRKSETVDAAAGKNVPGPAERDS
jgi:Tat protein translocase TatB subunit